MKALDRQKLSAISKTWNSIFNRCRQLTLDSKLIEFEKSGNCGESATIRNRASATCPVSNPVEFDGIGMLAGLNNFTLTSNAGIDLLESEGVAGQEMI